MSHGRSERLLRAMESIGLDVCLRPWLAGLGAIFCLHRVAEAGSQLLDPDMTVSTELLDNALRVTRAEGYQTISIDQVPEWVSCNRTKRFAVFTFDDGYKDNLTVGLPVFREHGVPICVYVATGLVDGTAPYWWGGLAHLIEKRQTLDLSGLGISRDLSIYSWEAKQAAFHELQAWVHQDLEVRVADLMTWLAVSGIDVDEVRRQAFMSWDELHELSKDPLVTIGAHTVNHPRLAQLDAASARHELASSRRLIQTRLGLSVRHLAFPYGGGSACGEREFAMASDVGYTTAVTTRNGNVFRQHAGRLTALPRRRVTEGNPDPRTFRRALTGSRWILNRGPRVFLSGT